METIQVHGPSIEGNLEGNAADRDVIVVLPPSYPTAPDKRYPVLYVLHGYSATADRFMVMAKVAEGARAAVDGGAPEMIVVVPDSYTRHGGSMYSTSVTVGDFETFIARDLVAGIDARYRTIPDRLSRGLAGHSMGGYGTLRLGMKHPDVFSALYAMSPCCIAPFKVPAARLNAFETMTLEQTLAGDFSVRAAFGRAAAWSPDPARPPMFLDIGIRDGALQPDVLAQWAANAPLAMLAQYVPALQRMRAIGMDVGDEDLLLADDTAMHDALGRFGIAHEWAVYSGNHVNRIADRFAQKVLPLMAGCLER
jgi:enterochelin esterase-like enzyme